MVMVRQIWQGQWKQSDCSDFGWTSFSQSKTKSPFLQKASNKQNMILWLLDLLGLLCVLSYNTYIEEAYQEVQDH